MQQLLGNDITNLAFYEAYTEYSEQSRAYRIQHHVFRTPYSLSNLRFSLYDSSLASGRFRARGSTIT